MPFIVCPTWKNLVPVLLMLHVSMSMAQSTITYTETFDDFLNPDRGFYTPTECKSSNNPTALTVTQLLSYRNTPYTPWQGNYTVTTSVVLREYILDNFLNAPISSSYLNIISADFAAARQAGVRLVLRFAYTDVAPMCGSSICPPYNDAPKARILGHIAQIKPILQANSDVILAVQQGFIGIWGEQYYTDHFGDASVQGNLTDQNWIDRLEVLDAVLNAVPSNRMVHVRYPQIKQKAVYGITAPVTSAAMTAAQAFQNTKRARIGFHNDCFLSASDDKGTYWDYGRSGVPASNQTAILKAYATADSKYVGVGGETCDDAFSPQNNCSGQARTDMDALNFAYLNADYNNAVNNDWQTDGCMIEIKRRLGYRFVLTSSTYPTAAAVGGSLTFSLSIKNVGFAAPANARALRLVLRNTTTQAVYPIELTGINTDSRLWLSGQTFTINQTITLPANIPAGTYALLLHLCDRSNNDAVVNRPEYSIRMANSGLWEPTTGYNSLNRTLSLGGVVSTAPAAPTGLTRTVLGISQVKLNWTDNATNETGFQIERSLSAVSGFVLVATLPSNTTTYTQSDLNVATTYYFRVRAINAAGNSNYTSTVSALTTGVTVNGSATEWSGVTALATAATGITSLKAASNATYLFLIAQGTINTNYNVLLNTDNNTATGYQGNWTTSGCDYLVQNGTLHKYNGTGSNWSWTTTDVTQTGILHVKNASVIELRIPRASMVGMATTIKLGVETSNSSWATTALLPTAGNAQATYTFPTTAFAAMVLPLPLELPVPSNLHLETRIYPNPSDGSFMLSYYAEEDNSTLTVELYSALGSLIQRITESDIALGNQQKALQFNNLEMGTYFLKSTVGMKTDVSRISVVR